jgi:uncharacterized membrane protein YfcA
LPLPDYPTLFWVTAAVAILMVGIAKAGFGGGVGAVATPLMALTISVTDAAAILLPLLIVADILSIRHYHADFDRRSLRLMIPGAVVGVLIGAFFFGYFDDNERILRMGLGILSLGFVAYQVVRSVLAGMLVKSKPPAYAGVALGGAAGFTSTLAHAGGPPATMYLLPQGFPRQVFVGTNVMFFFALNLIKVPAYGFLGLLRIGNLTTILILAPFALLGVRLGVYLNRRFSEKWFNRVVYALLFLTGLELVSGRSLVSLLFS